MMPAFKDKLLEAKKGLIVGIANEKSIAGGCAKAFRALGAELAVTYFNDKAKKFVELLAREVKAPIVMPFEVRVPGQMEAVFERISKDWGKFDFLVHLIAFSPKDAPRGGVIDAPLDGFLATMEVFCWTFIRMAHVAEPLMRKGGTLFTMTYYGSQMVVKNYNIMGVAKAALESAVRYLAAELGPKGIRVHAISPGPLATRGGFGHPRVRRAPRQSKGEGSGPQPRQHRGCGHRHRLPSARRGAPDHRRDALRRRRLPHHRLARLGSERQPKKRCQLRQYASVTSWH
jgi:enoyl-[acyl-carrier protein] reductase I